MEAEEKIKQLYNLAMEVAKGLYEQTGGSWKTPKDPKDEEKLKQLFLERLTDCSAKILNNRAEEPSSSAFFVPLGYNLPSFYSEITFGIVS